MVVTQPLRALYRAMALILLSASAHAMNVGQANVQSSQDEPLSAVIVVTNIDAASFSVSTASGSVYQQMGLVPSGVQARFIPTGTNSGKIELTSSAPISTPFADVVLDINHGGTQAIVPQTLLMPMGSAPKPVVAPIVVAATPTPNLPQVSTPIIVRNEAPPPINDGIDAGIDLSQGEPIDDLSATPMLANTQADAPTENTQGAPSDAAIIATDASNTDDLSALGIGSEVVNVQNEVLTLSIKRIITPVGEPIPQIEQPRETPQSLVAHADMAPTTEQTTKDDTPPSAPQETARYTIQRGDNLWRIANDLARANQLPIEQVINVLHTQNPDAFFNGDKNRLKVGATLTLPNYDTIPSQRAIGEAMSAKTEKLPAFATRSDAKKATRDTKSSTKNTRADTQNNAQKPLPQARVSLVSPQTGDNATGGANSGNRMNAKAGGNPLAKNLTQKRSAVIQKAARVGELSEQLSGHAERIQLQNQRLAQLEKRLKELKNKP